MKVAIQEFYSEFYSAQSVVFYELLLENTQCPALLVLSFLPGDLNK